MSRLIPILATLTLAGCGAGFDLAANGQLDDGSGEAQQPSQIRIDVYPPSIEAGLLPQTHIVRANDNADDGDEYLGLALDLKPTVHLTGTLTALVSTGWSSMVTAPTEAIPLAGEIRAWIEGSLESAGTRSDATGAFAIDVVADAGYDVAFIPSDAAASPFTTLDNVNLGADRDFSQELAEGAPLYGKVEDSSGARLAGVPVRVRRTDVAVDAQSSVLYTDDNGWFVARVLPGGTYQVETLGGPSTEGVTIPSVSGWTEVVTDEGAYVHLDVGTLNGNTLLTAAVLDSGGARLRGATVRLASSSLEGCEACGLSTETQTDSNGLFIARLLPGEYVIEVIPEATESDVTASPVRAPVHVASGTTDLGELQLPGAGRLEGNVVTSGGGPAADVLVSVAQLDFGQFHYSTSTDSAGHFAIDVPASPYQVTLTPKAGSGQGSITHAQVQTDVPEQITLAAGQEVSGTVQFDEEPIAWALVEVHDATTGELLGSTTTGEEGTFSVLVAIPEREAEDTGADTGSDTGADTGSDTGADTGSDTGADTGSDTGADTGGDTGADTGGDTAF